MPFEKYLPAQKNFAFHFPYAIIKMIADMAELADALDSGSNENFLVQVQVLLSALFFLG